MTTDQNPLTPDEEAKFEAFFARRQAEEERKKQMEKLIPSDVRDALGEIVRANISEVLKEVFGDPEGEGGDDTSKGRPKGEGGAEGATSGGFLRLLGYGSKAAGDE